MSAPITEAHRAIAEKLGDLLDIEQMTGPSPAEQAAQLIADSEAAAVQIAMIREYGNLCATNESLAKECDQLRAEIARIDSEKPWLKEANATNADLRAEVERLRECCDKTAMLCGKFVTEDDGTDLTPNPVRIASALQRLTARAERAEDELAVERARLDDLLSINATGAARLAHAAVQLATEREKVRALRLACERIVAQWDADHDTNPIGAGGLMYTRASFALAATEDAQ